MTVEVASNNGVDTSSAVAVFQNGGVVNGDSNSNPNNKKSKENERRRRRRKQKKKKNNVSSSLQSKEDGNESDTNDADGDAASHQVFLSRDLFFFGLV